MAIGVPVPWERQAVQELSYTMMIESDVGPIVARADRHTRAGRILGGGQPRAVYSYPCLGLLHIDLGGLQLKAELKLRTILQRKRSLRGIRQSLRLGMKRAVPVVQGRGAGTHS